MNGFDGVGKMRDAVAKHLSEAQLAEAQKRVEQLITEISARRIGNERQPGR
jgi:hypothetical protein